MSAQAESANTAAARGKAAEVEVQDNGMDVDSSSDEEADEVVDDQDAPEDLEEEEENMEEINPVNIISSGRRTRGVKIDFAKAAAEMGPDNDDEEADDDFVEPPEESDAEMKDPK